MELTDRHFTKLMVKKLEDTHIRKFDGWLDGMQAPIVVCGAYGRSELSMIFRRSFAAKIISGHKIPLFITHRS